MESMLSHLPGPWSLVGLNHCRRVEGRLSGQVTQNVSGTCGQRPCSYHACDLESVEFGPLEPQARHEDLLSVLAETRPGGLHTPWCPGEAGHGPQHPKLAEGVVGYGDHVAAGLDLRMGQP